MNGVLQTLPPCVIDLRQVHNHRHITAVEFHNLITVSCNRQIHGLPGTFRHDQTMVFQGTFILKYNRNIFQMHRILFAHIVDHIGP